MNIGIFYAIIAYVLWGLLPFFWKSIIGVPAYEILLHRIVWSLVFLFVFLALKKDWSWITSARKDKKLLIQNLVSSILLSCNWFVYIWAVSSNHIIESSLGYFLNPLVYILLGRIFLKESVNRYQIIAIIIAASGLIYLTIIYGKFPWIALVLAFSFGFYGLLKKKSKLNSLRGLSMETFMLIIPSILFLLYLDYIGKGNFCHTTMKNNILLIMSGIATSIPLLFFAGGAKRITLMNLGFIQYIAPSLQFLLGVYFYKENFSSTQFTGFILIWISLLIYTADSIVLWKKRRQ